MVLRRTKIRIHNDLTVHLAVMNGSEVADLDGITVSRCRLLLSTNRNIYIDILPVNLTINGNIVSFEVPASVQRVRGDYYLHMEYTVPDGAHSLKVYAFTLIDLSAQQYTEQDTTAPPDVYISAIVSVNIPPESLLPYIGTNGNWFVNGVDTGVSATGPAGENGVSVTNVNINSSGHLIVTLSNGTIIDAGSVYADDLVTQAQLDIAINNVQSQITLNTNAISNLSSEVDSLRQQITDRTHFRGTYQTTAGVEAIANPTDGDYAYNLETLTQWNYENGGWADTGIGIPDQTTPLSDVLPLPDGTADAGTSNEASRGDHIHPHDATKQDVLVPGNNISISGTTISATLPAIQIHTLIYVDGQSTATSEDGSIYAPYKTIQAGINALQFGYGLVIGYGEYTLDTDIVVANKQNNTIFAVGFAQQWRTKIDANWTVSGCSRIEIANLEINGAFNFLNNDGIYPRNLSITGLTDIQATGYYQFKECQLTGITVEGSASVDLFDCTEEDRSTALGVVTTNTQWIFGTTGLPNVNIRDCRWCVINHQSGILRVQYSDIGFDSSGVSIYSNASTITGGRLFLESGTCWQPHGTAGTIQQTGDGVYTIGSFEYEPTANNTFLGQRRDGWSLHSSQIYDHNVRMGYTKASDRLDGHLDGISQQFINITDYFPASLQSPADDSQVVRTATDVQINAHKLDWNGAGYTENDEQIVVPSADPTHAGAYPSDHYNRVQNVPANTNTALLAKADLVGGIVPASQLPAAQRTIIRGVATGLDTSTTPATATGFNDENGNPVTPDPNVQYFGQQSNLTFLYNTNNNLFVAINGGGIQLGETEITAYRGDRGATAYNHSQIISGDPHGTIAQAALRTVGGTNIRGIGDIPFPAIPTALPNPNALNINGTLYDGSAPVSMSLEPAIAAGTALQYWSGTKTWLTLPTTLPNPQFLTFTGGSTATYNGSTAQTVNIPILPTRVKANQTAAVTLANGTATTLATTLTVASTQSNANIIATYTFLPDSATIVLAGLLNTLNISVQCDFLVNGTVIDTKYDTVQRTGTNQSRTFYTNQNVTAGQVISIRITPTFSAGSCTIPASTTANFITVS